MNIVGQMWDETKKAYALAKKENKMFGFCLQIAGWSILGGGIAFIFVFAAIKVIIKVFGL